ncbi:hypothetical protein [Amycolatopsis sp. NPDC004625]|uniref:hypothetical protein n=1 Tax=Amycolatopsis sp. NPDC004625 TaxID=3154670 RepID=UPI0033BB7683
MTFFVIRDGSAVPAAVVEVDHDRARGFTHDLVWVPFDLPDEAAEECSHDESRQHVHTIVRHVRAERQRTQWQGEYEYFVHLAYPDFADELKGAKALVRGRDGVRERLGEDGTWRATGEDPEGTVSLAITEAEHDRLRWEIAQAHWFVARDELPYPVAVVRRIPAVAEAYTRNLRWEPVPPGLELEAVGSEYQAEDLRAKLETGVRLAARAEGTEYFGVKERASGTVLSVIRRVNGVEEVFVREGWWARSDRLLRDFDRCLPLLGAEEAEQVIARLPRSRCFLVDDGRTAPRAVVHLDGDTERIFGRDLEWRTGSLRDELAGHPHRTVEETGPDQVLIQAYHLARQVRRVKQRHEWDGDAWYFGIYGTYRETFDIAATRLLVRTGVGDTWFGERYAGQGRWEETRELDDIWRGRSYDNELALSPAEAEAIVKRLG